MFRVCHAFLSVHCSPVVTCWERADHLALLCVIFYCVFVTFLCGVLGRVWYLIVSISDLCPLTYFENRGSYKVLGTVQSRYNTPHYNLDLDIKQSSFGSQIFFYHEFYKRIIGK